MTSTTSTIANASVIATSLMDSRTNSVASKGIT
jgi:hypothetical protein